VKLQKPELVGINQQSFFSATANEAAVNRVVVFSPRLSANKRILFAAHCSFNNRFLSVSAS
jgi:hypothetical protein